LPWHYGEFSRQDIVFEETIRRFPDVEIDLSLVPDKIGFDFFPSEGT
jgi:hypothetical protein